MNVLRRLGGWAVACLFLIGVCPAAEVILNLPEPLIPGTQMNGILIVKDPPAQITKIVLPVVAGLEWQVLGRTGTRTTVINGAQSAEVSFGLSLRAAAEGVLQVPPVVVKLRDGADLKSRPVTVRVAQGDAKLTGEAVAEVAFEPARIVPGESTNLVFRLHLRQGDVKTLGVGPPEGAISLGDRTATQNRSIDAQGQEWTTLTITWPMTHATPGTYTVRGQQEYLIQVNDGFFGQWVRRQVAVPPASLTVEALPTQGRPAEFTGLIGPLTVTASLERERVAAGEGAVVAIAITGRQTDLVKRPALTVGGVQVYAKDDTTKDGVRTFRWDLVPAAPGQVTIPPVHIPYFDPGSRSYRTADSQPLTLTVIPGRLRDLGVVGGQSAPTAAPQTLSAAPTLPAPIHGTATPRPPSWLAPAAGAGGLILGLGAALAARLPRRAGPHRGRALRQAGRDPAALATALARLRPALSTPEQRAAADQLEAAVDRARFGGVDLPDIGAWVALLGDVP